MRVGLVALVVRDYDEAIDFYVHCAGFRLASDEDQGGGKRWVVVTPESGASLLLAKAVDDRQPEHPERLERLGCIVHALGGHAHPDERRQPGVAGPYSSAYGSGYPSTSMMSRSNCSISSASSSCSWS